MTRFPSDHIFILPHANEYRQFYSITHEQVLDCLNAPDTREGLNTDHYTAEKKLGDHYIYVYYYLTYPLQAADNEMYIIVDFIGYTEAEQQTGRQEQKGNGKAKKTYDPEYFKRMGALGGKKRIANLQTLRPKQQNP